MFPLESSLEMMPKNWMVTAAISVHFWLSAARERMNPFRPSVVYVPTNVGKVMLGLY